ncbi:MAG: hypothetical protein WCQ50_17445 [Spirochaetota bacterium]
MADSSYFQDDERFVAAIDEGRGGFFIRNGTGSESVDWRFIVPGSLAWDAIHQDIYYAGHDLGPCPPEIVVTLPPLPPIPPFERIEWKANFEPTASLLAKDFPALLARLATKADVTEHFWFILEEDRYETILGDGEFLYFKGMVFETEKPATDFVLSANRESERRMREKSELGTFYSAKGFALGLEDDRLKPRDYEPEAFEHSYIEEIIKRIEETVASDGLLPWGTRKSGY